MILFKLFVAMLSVKSSEELRLMEYCPDKFTVPTEERQPWHFICTLKLCMIKVVCPCFANFYNLILTLKEISNLIKLTVSGLSRWSRLLHL